MPENNKSLPSVNFYTPVELVGIYRSFLERGMSNGVVWLRGIYIYSDQTKIRNGLLVLMS